MQAVDKLLLMRNFPELEVAHFDAAEVESQVSCCLVLLLPLLALFERSADSFQDRVTSSTLREEVRKPFRESYRRSESLIDDTELTDSLLMFVLFSRKQPRKFDLTVSKTMGSDMRMSA